MVSLAGVFFVTNLCRIFHYNYIICMNFSTIMLVITNIVAIMVP